MRTRASIGYFSGLHEGMEHSWSLLLFPFKHDTVLAGNRTVRDVIVGLQAEEGPVFKSDDSLL